MDSEIIGHIKGIDRINKDAPEDVAEYFLGLNPEIQKKVIGYYAYKAIGLIPDICKNGSKKEYPLHINPKWSSYENYLILEEIKNDSVYTYNFNHLPEDMQDEIIKIYGKIFSGFAEIEEYSDMVNKISRLFMKKDIRTQNPILN